MVPKPTATPLTQESFESLLDFLGPDRELAGAKYEEVRRRLIVLFRYRGSETPEELADETINRVARQSKDLLETYEGDPIRWFCGVARNVFLESVRKREKPLPIPDPDPPEEKEVRQQCLDRCMKELEKRSEDSARLVLDYHRGERSAKIEHRRALAKQRGMTLNALRIKVHRITKSLEGCVLECVGKVAEG